MKYLECPNKECGKDVIKGTDKESRYKEIFMSNILVCSDCGCVAKNRKTGKVGHFVN